MGRRGSGVGFLCGGVGGEGGREDAEGLLTGDGERRMAGDGTVAGFPGGGACGDEVKEEGMWEHGRERKGQFKAFGVGFIGWGGEERATVGCNGH
jgi:hypothetical protein